MNKGSGGYFERPHGGRFVDGDVSLVLVVDSAGVLARHALVWLTMIPPS